MLNTIKAIVHTILIKSGVRTVDHSIKYNRKEVPKSHGFRKFFTTQFVNSKVNPEIREMLLGHKIGLASCYYKPTISKEERRKRYWREYAQRSNVIAKRHTPEFKARKALYDRLRNRKK